MRCFQQLPQQRIPERIDEQSVDDVPPISMDFSVPRFMNRTVEQLVGGFCPSDFEAHPGRGQGGSTDAQASNETVESTSGAECVGKECSH